MILDACCGSMKMYNKWHERLGGDFVSIDIRRGEFQNPHNTHFDKIKVKPMVQADMKHLPFRENIFDGIVFDPPHMDAGLGSWVYIYYGYWTQRETIRALKAVNQEFRRCLKNKGFLAMKIDSSHRRLFETVLSNFVFFLPILIPSKSNRTRREVLWTIGQLKDAA